MSIESVMLCLRISVSVRPSGLSQVAVGNLSNQAPTLITAPHAHAHTPNLSGSIWEAGGQGVSAGDSGGILHASPGAQWALRLSPGRAGGGSFSSQGFGRGVTWQVTLHRADQDTSAFCVPKFLLLCITLFLPFISLLLRLSIFFLFGQTGSLMGS